MTSLPTFEIVARHRPIAIVGTPIDGPGLRLLAPYGAAEIDLTRDESTGGPAPAPAHVDLVDAEGRTFSARWDGRVASLEVDGRIHRSRRHARAGRPPRRLAVTLTGPQLTVLTLEDDTWLARGRVDLTHALPDLDVHDPAWLAGLHVSGHPGHVRSGVFGQLGLRDIRLVTEADGAPYRRDGEVLLTATSAGPGFFATAHTSVWALRDDDTVEHRADLFFQRPGGVRAYGDHATHLVRDGERWLVATSTWADFPSDRAARQDARVEVILAETTADVTRGQHLLPTRALALPTRGPSVGVWDPHLVRADGPDGDWLVGYVSARRFFDFHPVVAAGPTLDDLTVLGAATDRRATEGTTLHRIGATWHVLASDGRDNRRDVRGRFPVFDLTLREVGTLSAPYPTNLPWPTVVPPATGQPDGRWRLVTFNGAPAGGPSAGYGTHGDLVLMHESGH